MANVALMFRNPPFNREDVFNTVRTNPTLTLANGFPEGGLAGSTSTPTITTIAQDYGPGYAQECGAPTCSGAWRPGGSREVGYVGSQTTGSRQRVDATTRRRQAPAPCRPRRPIPTFGDIRVFDTDAEAEYNGLQLRAQNLDFYGMNVLATYT